LVPEDPEVLTLVCVDPLANVFVVRMTGFPGVGLGADGLGILLFVVC